MNLAEILARKQAEKKEDGTEDNLRLFFYLAFRIEQKDVKSLMVNDWHLAKNLASFCSPFPSYNKEDISIVPAFYQTYYLWNISRILDIPPGILWKKIKQFQLECE